jgi:hypothetical protein
MIVVLSGEGVSDLGQCTNALGECSGDDYQMGAMAILLDKMIEPKMGYSLRTVPNAYQFVSEAGLQEQLAKRKTEKNKISFSGKKRDQETGYFYINAWMLGEIALTKEQALNDIAIAVLFRDFDGTCSTKSGIWFDKHQSMINGFQRAGFPRGVPMLPKPKSEAWLICAAQKQAYQGCEKLEDLSGNDDSPNSVKNKLDSIFGYHKSASKLCDWLEENSFDVERAQSMPSFKTFNDDLNRALDNVLRGGK